MADPAAPKLDFKMLVVPAVLFFGKSIDFKNPEIAEMLRNIFVAGTSSDDRLLLLPHCRLHPKARA
jgi:hypothetical protein